MPRDRSRRRVALYGGSFDPPHICHVLAAQWALAMLPVDELWFVPVWQHAFGKQLSPFETRVALCRAAAASVGPRAKVSELERDAGTTYTADLLTEAVRRWPGYQWHLLVGTDVYAKRAAWSRWEQVSAMATVHVVGRAGSNEVGDVTMTLPDVSSTALRDELASGVGPLARAWLPHRVRRLVERKGLYQAGASIDR